MLLALDTSASASAAVLEDGAVLAAAAAHDPRRHAEVLLPLVEQVLAEAGADRSALTAVAVGVGPGPFTGLRVGMVSAVTVGHALGLPVLGVCSLDALALRAHEVLGDGLPPTFAVATDARRREVYWATYRVVGEQVERTEGPGVAHPTDVAVRSAGWVGRGTRLYPEQLPVVPGAEGDDLLDPPASAVGFVAAAALAGRGSLPLLPVEPLYLRRPDAVPAPPRAPAPTAS